MKKKGFTLIELLAVIVILAIVALILTPIISDIIECARKASAMRSVEGYISAANNEAAISLVDINGILVTKDKYSFESGEDDAELSKIIVSGKKPSYVYLEYDVELQAVVYGSFCQNGFALDYDNGKITDGAIDYCSTSFVDRPRVVVSAPNKLNPIVTMSIEFSENTVSGQYKIGTGEYIDYTEPVEISASKELASQRDENGNLKICAKATLASGETTEICRTLIKLDLDYPADPVIVASAGYPTLTITGVSTGTLSITFDTRDGIKNYVSFNGTDWSEYTGNEEPTSSTVYAKTVKIESGLESVATATVSLTPATDAISSEAYDGDDTTAMIYHAGHNNLVSGTPNPPQYRYMNIDQSVRGQYMYVKWYSWNYNKYISYIDFVDESGNVVGDTYSIDGGRTETILVNIPSNAYRMRYYMNIVSGANYNTNGMLYEITIHHAPIVDKIDSYPVLTSSGVTLTPSSMSVAFSFAAVQKLYRINDGEWQNYIDSSFISSLPIGTKVDIKSVDGKGHDSEISTIQIKVADDAITSEAYDENDTTAMIYHTGYNNLVSGTHNPPQYRYMNIDQSVRGQKMYVKWYSWNYTKYVSYIDFVDASGNVVGDTYSIDGGRTETVLMNIPSNAYRMRYYMNIVSAASYSTNGMLYEITIHHAPIIDKIDSYPNLTSSGVTLAPSSISVTFSFAAVQKLYRINNGSWQNYIDSSFVSSLPVGTKIDIKSVNGGGQDSAISTIELKVANDAITSEAYDGDDTTAMIYHAGYNNLTPSSSTPYQYRYMYIDQSMRGGQATVKWYCWNRSGYAGHLEFVDDTNTVVGTAYSIDGGRTETITVDIPSTAVKMRYYDHPVSDVGYSTNGMFYEITPIH